MINRRVKMSKLIHTTRGTRWVLLAVSGLSVVYLILLVVPNLSQIAQLDEVVFLRALQNPPGYAYYVGEDVQDGVLVPRFLPYEHAPFYLQMLDLTQHLLPTSPLVASRLLGVLCILGAALIMGLNVQQLAGVKWLLVCALAFVGYLSNPLVIRSTTFLDIDTSLLPLLTMLFVYLCVRFWFHQKSLRIGQLLLLSLAFFLCLWTKESTPIALIGSLFAYEAFNSKETQRLRNLRSVLVVAGLGIGMWLLAALWFTVRAAVPLDTLFRISYGDYMLGYALPKGTSFSALISYLTVRVKDFAAVVLWLSPGFFALWVVDLGLRFKRVLRGQGMGAWDWMALYSVMVFAGYIMIKGIVWDFPKYHLPMVPVAAMLVADRIADFMPLSRKTLLTGSLLVILGWVFFSLTMGDPFFDVFNKYTYTKTKDELLVLGRCLAFFVVGCIIALGVVREWGKGLMLGLVAITLAWNLGLSTLQSRAAYSTTYHYGEKGLEQVVELVRANTSPSDLLLARKDIAFAAGRRYMQVDKSGIELSISSLVETLAPPLVILSNRHAGANDPVLFHQQLHRMMDAAYPYSEVIGDFILFAKDPSTLR